MIRVISGELGGRRLQAPPGLSTRPTADRVRQSLFNILDARAPIPAGATVLDLYAGTGALGIEALSRGAARAVFVEQDVRAGAILQKNLAALGLLPRALVLTQPVARALEALSRPDPARAAFAPPFHYIFADPPYALEALRPLLAVFGPAGPRWLGADGLFVIEHGRREPAPARASDLAQVDSRRYGDTVLSFYACAGAGDDSAVGDDTDVGPDPDLHRPLVPGDPTP